MLLQTENLNQVLAECASGQTAGSVAARCAVLDSVTPTHSDSWHIEKRGGKILVK